MSSSYGRRARRLARKQPEDPDYLLGPETPAEWRAEIAAYLDFDEHELKRDLPIIRERVAELIEACPHEEVKAWARGGAGPMIDESVTDKIKDYLGSFIGWTFVFCFLGGPFIVYAAYDYFTAPKFRNIEERCRYYNKGSEISKCIRKAKGPAFMTEEELEEAYDDYLDDKRNDYYRRR
jgi:hypothetical protein